MLQLYITANINRDAQEKHYEDVFQRFWRLHDPSREMLNGGRLRSGCVLDTLCTWRWLDWFLGTHVIQGLEPSLS